MESCYSAKIFVTSLRPKNKRILTHRKFYPIQSKYWIRTTSLLMTLMPVFHWFWIKLCPMYYPEHSYQSAQDWVRVLEFFMVSLVIETTSDVYSCISLQKVTFSSRHKRKRILAAFIKKVTCTINNTNTLSSWSVPGWKLIFSIWKQFPLISTFICSTVVPHFSSSHALCFPWVTQQSMNCHLHSDLSSSSS